ncbi:MAG: DUF1707 SHOCT-like domain-containing protein [Solirubrobacteraceae bacterium]
MRLSDVERDQLIDTLSRHAAEGRLEVADLERRVATVLAAQSREEAVTALADLPPLAAESPRRARPTRRGHGDADSPAADWVPTNERFRDPRSARIMRVWVDSAGARHYVAEDERAT